MNQRLSNHSGLISLFFVIATMLAAPKGFGQTYSQEECIKILDSLYYESDIGDISNVVSSTLFHLSRNSPDSTKGILASYLAYVLENEFQYDSALKYYSEAFNHFRNANDSLSAAHITGIMSIMGKKITEDLPGMTPFVDAMHKA